jgi:hypothetical protein
VHEFLAASMRFNEPFRPFECTYGQRATTGVAMHFDDSWIPGGMLALLCACSVCACSGSGAGLDENGRPVTDPGTPLTAEFASLQTHVFTPYCTGCHAGAAAPLGLQLTEGAAYAALVNAPSVEVPSLRRVQPGNPDASYLVRKISGTAAVGGRMPLGGPPLPQDAIDAIRQWIVDGAAPPRAAATISTAPFTQLAAVFPLEDARVDFKAVGLPDAMSGAIVIAATAELDAASLTTGGLALERSGGDGTFDDGNDVALGPLTLELRSLEPTIFAITPPVPWVPDRYRLTIRGSGPLPVRDRLSRAIDGDFDLIPGGDYVLQFDVGTSGATR